MSLDMRVPAKRYTLLLLMQVVILEYCSLCNDLLLCCTKPDKFYVYSSSINVVKMIPQNSMDLVGSLRMAFDPTKSPHYKVVHAECISNVQIQTYPGVWSVCGSQFPHQSFQCFQRGIFRNDAIHWLNYRVFGRPLHFKLDIAEHEHPVLVNIETPVSADGKVHYDFKLFESRGCLSLLCRVYTHCQRFCIYEMSNGFSVWSVKYHVNLDAMFWPYLQTRMMPVEWGCSNFWCIVLGEREDDSFLLMELYGSVVQFKIMSETFSMISVFGLVKPSHYFRFIPSFGSV